MTDKYSIAAAGKWVAALAIAGWGDMPGVLHWLVLLSGIDYFTGFIAAWANRELSSAIGRKGLVKKLEIFILLLTVHLIQNMSGKQLHLDEGFGFLYIINEFISIVENCYRGGAPIPEGWVSALQAVKSLNKTASPAQMAALEKTD